MIFSLILILSAFMISLVGTKLLIVSFRNTQMMVERRGTISVPRAGGLAVVFALLIPMMVKDTNFALMLGVFLLASVYFLGELIKVPVWVGFLVQIAAVATMISTMRFDLFGDVTPIWLDKYMVGVLWLFCIQMFREMDGIEGMTAMQMMSIGLALGLVVAFANRFSDTLSLYSLIVAAVGAGFLWWNWPPAKILLSSVGSVPLGFVMGYVFILACYDGYVAAVLIVPAYYIVDSLLALVAAPDEVGYGYNGAIKRGWKPKTVVRLIAGINVLLGTLAAYSVIEPDLSLIFVALAYMAVFMLLGFFKHERATS